MLAQSMASLVVATEKTYGCYGTNIQKMSRKGPVSRIWMMLLLGSDLIGDDYPWYHHINGDMLRSFFLSFFKSF